MYCSSSAYASAHGTPSRKALVLMIHKALPLNDRLALLKDVSEEAVVVAARRAEGGIMSFKAERRSARVSSSTSSSSLETSDSNCHKGTRSDFVLMK